MCKFCNVGPNDAIPNKPIFDKSMNTGFFGEIRNVGAIQYIDNEYILYICISSENGLIDDKKYIKYCPMCGRKLEAADEKTT